MHPYLCALLLLAGFAAGNWFWHARLEPVLWGMIANEAVGYAAQVKGARQ